MARDVAVPVGSRRKASLNRIQAFAAWIETSAASQAKG